MLLGYSSFGDGLFRVLENFDFYTFIHDQKSKLYKEYCRISKLTGSWGKYTGGGGGAGTEQRMLGFPMYGKAWEC